MAVPRLVAPALATLVFTLGGCAHAPHSTVPDRSAIAATPDICPACDFPAPPPPVGIDALVNWRHHFPRFLKAYVEVSEALPEFEAADAPVPAPAAEAWAEVTACFDLFRLGPGECLVFYPCHGPETPFPDHYPLRHIALARTVEARRLIARGEIAPALDLARQNLAQARATLRGQTGLLGLIHATGVWQAALDAAHALARSPALSPTDADALRRELEADEGLLAAGVSRAFRGEYTYVFSVVVARLPTTRNLDHLLDAIASLGMAPPEPEPPATADSLISERPLLEPAATLAEFSTDMLPYLAALDAEARLPRGLYARTTARRLEEIRAEIPALLGYADGTAEADATLLRKVRAELRSVANPVGKLLFSYLVSAWEPLLASSLRREAQRGAVVGLLAWRTHGRPAAWPELVAAGRLSNAPKDPFSQGDLLFDTTAAPRVWSVFADGISQGGVGEPGNSGQPDDLVWPW